MSLRICISTGILLPSILGFRCRSLGRDDPLTDLASDGSRPVEAMVALSMSWAIVNELVNIRDWRSEGTLQHKRACSQCRTHSGDTGPHMAPRSRPGESPRAPAYKGRASTTSLACSSMTTCSLIEPFDVAPCSLLLGACIPHAVARSQSRLSGPVPPAACTRMLFDRWAVRAPAWATDTSCACDSEKGASLENSCAVASRRLRTTWYAHPFCLLYCALRHLCKRKRPLPRELAQAHELVHATRSLTACMPAAPAVWHP